MRIGIINSGGDVQGINAVISSVVHAGHKLGHEFLGFIKGWEGLLDKDFIHLDIEAVRGISHVGGTILYSVNKGRFAGKSGSDGAVNKIPDEVIVSAKANCHELGIDALIVIGGDGTLTGALQLAEAGINIIGVPKTIDNDLQDVDRTFGFSTAVNVAVEAIDRIHTTAHSHQRFFFVETMGRHAGWIALHSGVGGGADAILLPEFPFSYTGLLNFMRTRREDERNYALIVVSEGAHAQDEAIVAEKLVGLPEVKLGGVSAEIMNRLERLAPGEFDMRNVVLGHIQRGGTPNADDRVLAKAYGVAAVQALQDGHFGQVVCMHGGQMQVVPIQHTVGKLKLITPDDITYRTAVGLGVYLGD
jgi:ATP-dependent phosphofructokinase / diphosphate-dependent phosphofructokinase